MRGLLITIIMLLAVLIGIVGVRFGLDLSDRAAAAHAAERAKLSDDVAKLDSYLPNFHAAVRRCEGELAALKAEPESEFVDSSDFNALTAAEQKSLRGKSLWRHVQKLKVARAEQALAQARTERDDLIVAIATIRTRLRSLPNPNP